MERGLLMDSNKFKMIVYLIGVVILTWIVSSDTLTSKVGKLGKFIIYFVVFNSVLYIGRKLTNKK